MYEVFPMYALIVLKAIGYQGLSEKQSKYTCSSKEQRMFPAMHIMNVDPHQSP